MIRAASLAGAMVLETDLPVGTVAYLDADWVVADTPSPLPELIVESDAAAGGLLAAVARGAVEASGALDPGSLEVSGRGLIAHEVRRRAGARLRAEGDRGPLHAWIDTTGDPSTIVRATEAVRDLGTVVLAGETLGRRLALNVYKDVHSRGLRLVGSPRPGSGGEYPTPEPAAPSTVAPGDRLPPAAWYRLTV